MNTSRVLEVTVASLLLGLVVACDDGGDGGEDAGGRPDSSILEVSVEMAAGGDGIIATETADAEVVDVSDAACSGDGGDAGLRPADVAADEGGECPAPCLTAISDACPMVGSCALTGSKPARLLACYANGVRANLAYSYEGSVFVYKASGERCYDADTTNVPGSSQAQLTWRGPAGNILLTAQYDRACGVVQVACSGSTYTITNPARCPALRGLVSERQSGISCNDPTIECR